VVGIENLAKIPILFRFKVDFEVGRPILARGEPPSETFGAQVEGRRPRSRHCETAAGELWSGGL
jgi:hypothetical protein